MEGDMPEHLKDQTPAQEPVQGDATPGAPDSPQEPAGTQEPAGKPEFFLDPDGNIGGAGLDSWVQQQPVEPKQADEPTEPDAGASGEGEPEPQEPQAQEPKADAKPGYYSPEELAALDFHEIDPSRLPPEVRPYYEEVAKTMNVAPPSVEGPQPQQPPQGDPLDALYETAKKRVEAKLGKPFDELDPKHIAALSLEVNAVAQEAQRMQRARAFVQQVASQEPYFAQIDAYAQQKLAEMPYKEAVRIQQAIAVGDVETVAKFWEETRKEWYEKTFNQKGQAPATQTTQATQPQPQAKRGPEPVAVESAGDRPVGQKPRIRADKFGQMTDDDKIEFLLKHGYVDQ